MVKAAKSLGAGPGQVVLKVIWPSALPTILAGYRLGAGWRCCSWCRPR